VVIYKDYVSSFSFMLAFPVTSFLVRTSKLFLFFNGLVQLPMLLLIKK